MTNVYREVKRKAAVGERIKVTNAWATGGLYKNGEVFTVTETHAEHEGAVIGVAERLSAVGIVVGEYVVLEPVTESIAPSPLSSDPLYAAFRQFVADNADGIRAILPEVEAQLSAEPPIRVAPVKLTRAQVIAKATADVAELGRIGSNTFADLPEEPPLRGKYYAVEFYVNRGKRAVTALVKRGSIVYAKHTAKCSPADVFHAEIGKAIALRKALGLTVPTEYTDAPQPDKKRVGMYVNYEDCRVLIEPPGSATGRVYNYRTKGNCEIGSEVAIRGTILDDTDVDYSVNADSAVSAKGVAA